MDRTTTYGLSIPKGTYDELMRFAQQEGTTIAELLRRAIKLFFFIRAIAEDPGCRLLIESKDGIKEIVLDLI